MNIDELTIGQAKQLSSLLGGTKGTEDDSHWKVGENYFIRTVTHHLTGKLEKVTDKELVLSSASWIADSGRFHNALRDGELSEVEPFVAEQVVVGRGALIDACVWEHELPRKQQ